MGGEGGRRRGKRLKNNVFCDLPLQPLLKTPSGGSNLPVVFEGDPGRWSGLPAGNVSATPSLNLPSPHQPALWRWVAVNVYCV